MLTSFTAQNFRLFTNLEIPRLSRVNLFVGRNNAGKSALLEAVEVYANNAAFQTLLNIISARDETWGSNLTAESVGSPLPNNELFRHLFKGHQFPFLDEKGIVVGLLNSPTDQLHLTLAAYRLVENETGLRRLKLDAALYQELLEEGGKVHLDLVATDGGRTRRIIGLDSRAPVSLSTVDMENKMPVQTVPTTSIPPARVAALWDVIGLTDLAQEVLYGLRLIEPTVTGIAFVKATGRYAKTGEREPRIPLVKLSNQPNPLPLRSMGDGITRLFHIILALVNAKQGVLLVDEFENGLHWSVQEKIWETVFQLAERLDVQVFATTHSRDCIQAFQAAWERHQNIGTYYRLEMDSQGELKARQYSLDTLADSIATDVETR